MLNYDVPFLLGENSAHFRFCHVIVYARYVEAQYQLEVVKACPVHCTNPEFPVFMQSNQAESILLPVENTKIFGILVPYPSGVDNPSISLKFPCLTTCNGGVNRRPIELVFELIKKHVWI